MSTTAAKPATTPIPVQLSDSEFTAFILPHLSMPKRGPKCKLGYHRVFNLILWVLYTGMQWKCLPIPHDAQGKPAIHYTTVYRVFAKWADDGSLWQAFLASVRHLAAEKHLDASVLHGDGTNTVAKKGGMAVAQKSPCEGKRVIMGQESPLKLGQRRQDASEEVPMRTPKQLYAHQRIIYQPALLTCPHCGDLLVMCNSLAWDKTVQTFDRVLSVASRPGHCPHVTCAGSRMRLLSAQAQRLALPGSTYGYDVLVRMAWWRQESRATYHEMHTALASQVRISASHVGSLSQQVSLPLLACHERQHRDHRAHIAQEQGGVMIALDGLAPQGGEPHMWFIRARTSGFTFRRGWLSQQDQTTFDALLQPLTHLAWPILAVLSDKQTGLVPAVALQAALSPFAQTAQAVQQGAAWLRDIASL